MTRIAEKTEVLIVGAGPTGLTLGATLRQAGIDVTIVDRAAEMASTSRAAVVHARTLELLHGVGVDAELLRRGTTVPRFTVREGDRALITIDFDDLPTAHPYTLMLSQEQTEAVLRERLAELGGEVHQSRELADMAQDADGVTATLSDGTVIRADYLVGADGMHSVVRGRAGIAFTGAAYEESFVLADVELDWDLSQQEVMLYFAPAGLVVIAPLPGGRHRIVATVDDAPEAPDMDFVQAILDERGPKGRPARVTDVIWSSRFRVHHRLADSYRDGRVFIAGDAAHVHSPAGGQGMNLGIQDAVALAGRLADVLRGGAEPGTLDQYEAERRPVAAQVVHLTDRLTALATVRGPVRRRARNMLLWVLDHVPAVSRKLAMNLSGLANRPAARPDILVPLVRA
jgi:2-polyprenyl-6-methoxyphenol hydroxylase-like FAD-dependent oxidoreductase